MEKKVSIVLVGINGYGALYLRELLANKKGNAKLAGIVEIFPKRSAFYEELIQQEVPIYDSLEKFYETEQADLAIISTPIHLHAVQSCYAMNHGSHVLCEKPMTGSIQDMRTMIDTRDSTGKFLAIGFNWSFTESIQHLKQDILARKFGKLKRAKTLVLWPRNQDYYNRSSWAGKKYSPNGDAIFDSVANNATAHYLHNLFYLAGETISTSSDLQELTAELYRANPIETFDTCAVSLKTKTGIEMIYIASHAVKETINPHFEFEFEKAIITYKPDNDNNSIVAQLEDGTETIYEDPNNDQLSKLSVCIDAIINGHTDIFCGPEAASPHVLAIEAMHKSVPTIPTFPEQLTHYDQESKLYWIEGLEKTLVHCYENWCLPNELKLEWNNKGNTIQF